MANGDQNGYSSVHIKVAHMELFHTDTDYSTLILRVFLLDQIAHVGVSPSISLKLFGREITFEIFQPL